MNTNLQGTWKGEIQSTWVHPSGEKLDPIPVILTILETKDRISCAMRTHEMTSKSENERIFVDEDTGLIRLTYQYQSLPDPSVRGRSEIHRGTMEFEFHPSPQQKLIGAYFSDRNTQGVIKLEFWKEDLVREFPESEEIHPAKGQDLYLKASKELKNTQAKFPLKVLFIGVSPEDGDTLRIGKESDEIKERIRISNNREQFDLQTEFASTTIDLQQSMLDHAPNILHFSGHAEVEGIYLEDAMGKGKQVPNEGLLKLLQLHLDSLNCVILNACFTEPLAEMISNLGLVVVGTSDSLKDIDAIKFSKGFYTALGAGRSFEFAFNSGVASLSLDGSKGVDVLTLKLPPKPEDQ